jgi:hypothetical protein
MNLKDYGHAVDFDRRLAEVGTGAAKKNNVVYHESLGQLFICAILGLAMLFVACWVLAHLRAVDAVVLQRAGTGGPL